MDSEKVTPKRFVNAKDTVVHEAIDGLLIKSAGMLTRLDGYPSTKVIVRTDWNKDKVALISGGGAGHEPAHAGFVGKGLLTAAVSGEIFASPTVDAVLSAILYVTGPKGCLLIVKNYTGDRLNFGLAAEKAKAEYGLNVKMVIMGDDVAFGSGSKQARGLAGTLFVHKIAGAAAESGASLEEVHQIAQNVCDTTRTLGLSFSTCTQPFSETNREIGCDIMEVGLGIHGEPGLEKAEITPCEQTSKLVVDKILACIDKKNLIPGKKMAILINNLGAVPPMEMTILVRDVFNAMPKGLNKYLVGPAPLMTSLDMNGISITLMPLNDEKIFNYLLEDCAAHCAWPHVSKMPCTLTVTASYHQNPLGSKDYREEKYWRDVTKDKILTSVCEFLISKESELNALDSKVGDGDTGT